MPGGAVAHAGRSAEAALDAIDLGSRPAEIWAASVTAPALRIAVDDWALGHGGISPRWVESTASACGVRCAYAQPEKLGVDRWLSLIGGYHRARGAACIVDTGTALTVDAVDAHGQHLGGLIAPGLDTQRQSLHRGTQVRSRAAGVALTWLGRDTDTAVTWGTLHGVIGLIERVFTAISREQTAIMPLITGGEAEQLLPYLGDAWVFAPDLVLEGLAKVALEETRTRPL